MLGCGARRGDVGRGMKGRCRKVCWGVGVVRGDVGKGEMREMWGSVLRPHTLTHFPTPCPFLSPHPFPTRQHTSSPHTLCHTPPHSPHTGTLSHTSPLPTHLSLPPPHPYTFPYTFPHSSPDLLLHHNTLPHSPHALYPHLPPQFRLGQRRKVTM